MLPWVGEGFRGSRDLADGQPCPGLLGRLDRLRKALGDGAADLVALTAKSCTKCGEQHRDCHGQPDILDGGLPSLALMTGAGFEPLGNVNLSKPARRVEVASILISLSKVSAK